MHSTDHNNPMNSQQRYDKYKRDREARRFYKSKAWLRCRKIVIIRDKYLCQRCLRQGKITKYDVVHHIKERKDYPELALDVNNLECLCHRCHGKHHPKGKKEEKEIPKGVVVFSANEDID